MKVAFMTGGAKAALLKHNYAYQYDLEKCWYRFWVTILAPVESFLESAKRDFEANGYTFQPKGEFYEVRTPETEDVEEGFVLGEDGFVVVGEVLMLESEQPGRIGGK